MNRQMHLFWRACRSKRQWRRVIRGPRKRLSVTKPNSSKSNCTKTPPLLSTKGFKLFSIQQRSTLLYKAVRKWISPMKISRNFTNTRSISWSCPKQENQYIVAMVIKKYSHPFTQPCPPSSTRSSLSSSQLLKKSKKISSDGYQVGNSTALASKRATLSTSWLWTTGITWNSENTRITFSRRSSSISSIQKLGAVLSGIPPSRKKEVATNLASIWAQIPKIIR